MNVYAMIEYSARNIISRLVSYLLLEITMFYSSFTKLALMISYFEIHFRVSTEKVINSVTCILWYFYFNCTTIKTFSREQFVTWILYFHASTLFVKSHVFYGTHGLLTVNTLRLQSR